MFVNWQCPTNGSSDDNGTVGRQTPVNVDIGLGCDLVYASAGDG